MPSLLVTVDSTAGQKSLQVSVKWPSLAKSVPGQQPAEASDSSQDGGYYRGEVSGTGNTGRPWCISLGRAESWRQERQGRGHCGAVSPEPRAWWYLRSQAQTPALNKETNHNET